MDLQQMIINKIRRDEIDQGEAAKQISEFYPMSRSMLNRFLNHEEIRNARHVTAMAKWVGFTDAESQIEFLRMYGFLSGFEEEAEKRLTLEYRLEATRKELEAMRRELELQRKGKAEHNIS